MRTRYAPLLSLVPTLALAQNVTFSESVTGTGGQADQVINLAECANAAGGATSQLTLSWTVNPAPPAGATYTVEVWDQACTASSANKHTLVSGLAPASDGSGTFNVSNVATQMLRASPLAVNCSVSTSVYACASVFDSTNAKLTQSASGELKVDVALPPAPVSVSASPGDSALNVSWTQPTGGAADAVSFKASAVVGGVVAASCTVTGGGSTS